MWKWVIPVVSLFFSCAYFNTFYNAKLYYEEGIEDKNFGRNVQASKKFDKSIEKCKKVIKKYPDSKYVDDAFLLIGKNYYEKGQYVLAINKFDEFLRYFPSSSLRDEALFYKALSLAELKRYAEAISILNQLKNKSKWKEEAVYNMGIIKKKSGSVDEAKETFIFYLKEMKGKKYRNEVLKNIAEILKEEERYEEAITYLRKYIRRAPPTVDYYRAKLELAELLWKTGRYEESLKEINGVIGVYSELNDEAELLRGKVYKSMGDYKRAMNILMEVKKEKKGEAMFEIAEIYEKESKYDTALMFYDSASSYAKQGSDVYIESLLRKALLGEYVGSGGDSTSISPEQAKFYLAEITLLNLKKPEEAVQKYREIYEEYPDSPLAPKAMFAEVWIKRNILGDSTWMEQGKILISKYGETEYAERVKEWMSNENK